MPARLLHVATVGLLAIHTVLGMKRPTSRGCRRRLPSRSRRRPRTRPIGPIPVEEARQKMREGTHFNDLPPIRDAESGVVFKFDKEGIPHRVGPSHYEILRHPLKYKVQDAFRKYCGSLSDKMKKKVEKSSRYQKWRVLRDARNVQEHRESNIMLWKLEAKYSRLIRTTDWGTVSADMEDSDKCLALNNIPREILGYRRKGDKRDDDDIMRGPADYLHGFTKGTERNIAKFVEGRHTYLTREEAASLGYDGVSKIRMAKDLLPNTYEDPNTSEDDDVLRRAFQAAVTAEQNKEIAAPRPAEESSSSSSEAASPELSNFQKVKRAISNGLGNAIPYAQYAAATAAAAKLAGLVR